MRHNLRSYRLYKIGPSVTDTDVLVMAWRLDGRRCSKAWLGSSKGCSLDCRCCSCAWYSSYFGFCRFGCCKYCFFSLNYYFVLLITVDAASVVEVADPNSCWCFRAFSFLRRRHLHCRRRCCCFCFCLFRLEKDVSNLGRELPFKTMPKNVKKFGDSRFIK